MRSWCLGIAPALLLACGPQPAAKAGGTVCDPGLEAGQQRLVVPPPLGALPSHVTVELDVSRERIQAEISQRVPPTLDQARRNIGAPGRVSYIVTRGPFGVDLRDGRLVATTRIRAQVEVCKELGPFCVTYGHCSPALLAVASVPLLPRADYALGPSQVSVTVEQGCRIAGYDATAQVEQIARQQAAIAQRRIDDSLPAAKPELERAWASLAQPWPLAEAGCLLAQPKSAALTRPRLDQGHIKARVRIDADLRWSPSCPAAAGTNTPLPALKLSRELGPDTRLELPVRVAWKEVEEKLANAVVRSGDEAYRVLEVRARPALNGDQRRVALGVRQASLQCGSMWFLAEPWYDATRGQIALRIADERANSPDFAPLRQRIEDHCRISLPLHPDRIKELVADLIGRFGTERPEGTELELGLEGPVVDRIVPDPEGIVAVLRLGARVVLRAP